MCLRVSRCEMSTWKKSALSTIYISRWLHLVRLNALHLFEQDLSWCPIKQASGKWIRLSERELFTIIRILPWIKYKLQSFFIKLHY